MKNRKIIAVNGHEIMVSHEIKTERNQTRVHFVSTLDGVTLNHVMNIGAEDQPLPADYSVEQLQADVDKARTKLATLVESKARAAKLATQIS